MESAGHPGPPRLPEWLPVAPRAEIALELALEAGFDLAGIAPLAPPAQADRVREWVARGHHAGMDWLERSLETLCDPRRLLPEGRSMLVVGLSHARGPVALAEGARVARYAAGRDYHLRIGKMLRKLGARLAAEGFGDGWRKMVDAAPLLERSHAAEAGLGFESRAANLLHPRFGPWFFLGELLLEADLDPTPTPPAGSCGTCTACIEACPTGALREPGVLDANLCLSYHTIENRGAIPGDMREELGPWVFGCDVCSEVCPWGRRAEDTADDHGTHAAVDPERRGSLLDWLATPEEGFAEAFQGSALRRPRREGLVRNAALALGHRPSEEGRAGLLAALEDPSPRVREAAGWSLAWAHGQDRGVAQALERAAGREQDPAARGDLAASRRLLGERSES